MKIVLATPLYPPDIEPTARYCKELAQRFAQTHPHELTVIAYGNLPEHTPNVTVITIDKRKWLLVRLALYTFKLWKAVRDADIVYVQNGASVELPLLLVTRITRTPFIFLSTDKNAIRQSQQNRMFELLARTMRHHARAVITTIPPEKPEVLSFSPRPEQELSAYEHAWTEHLRELSRFNP